jgi:hypothetical protein
MDRQTGILESWRDRMRKTPTRMMYADRVKGTGMLSAVIPATWEAEIRRVSV